MQGGWVWFSAWRRDVCALSMAIVGSERRSKLQLPSCFWSFLHPFSSLITQHPKRFSCVWSISVFSLRERAVSNRVAAGSWGEEGSPSIYPMHLYPLLMR